MARLFTTGFEEGVGNLLTTMWTSTVGGADAPTVLDSSPPTTHSGGYYMRTSATAVASYLTLNLAAAKTSGTLLTRLYVLANDATLSADSRILAWVSNTASDCCYVELLTTGALKLTNAAAGTNSTGTTILANGTWYRIEHKVVLSNTVGWNVVKVYSDAGTLLDTLLLGTADDITGSQDTLPAAANYLTVRVGKTASLSTLSYDDIAINDESGSFQNSYPGAGKIALMTPAANNGVAWAPTASATNYANVNETSGPFLFSDFYGAAQYLTCADLAAHDMVASGAFTLAGVVRTDSVSGDHMVVSHYEATVGWAFGTNNANLVLIATGVWGGFGTSTTELTTGVWYGIAATRPASSANVTLWRYRLDTQAMASETISMGTAYADGASNGVIGGAKEGATPQWEWHGRIAQVGIDIGTVRTEQQLIDFFRNATSTGWDSRWDLPSLTDTGTAGATLTNVGTLTNDTTYNSDSGTSNEDQFTLTALPTAVPSNAVMTLLDVYGRVSATNAVSGTMALKVWDEAASATQGPTITVSSATWRILTTAEHQVLSLSGKTKANVESYKAGYKALSAATSTKAVTAVWANVEWTDPTAALSGLASTSGRGTSVPGISVPL